MPKVYVEQVFLTELGSMPFRGAVTESPNIVPQR